MPQIYLDHSATTPTDPRVVQTMLPYFTEVYGNASSAHSFGRNAENAIEDARETIARVLNCQPDEIVFTSGGSESDNLAVRGAAWAARQQGKGTHLITTPIEHGAVGKTIDQLATFQGFEKTVLPVDATGAVSVDDFTAACRPGTTFASVMYANNEVGTIQPVAQLAAAAHERGVLFHTDAVQAAGQLSLDVQQLGVDLLSLSGHKLHCPKGVGVLYVNRRTKFIPFMTGGGQEGGKRAGTENVASIVIVGANGSGKSRLGAWIDSLAIKGLVVHRVSAQRALTINDYVQPRPLEQAGRLLYYGSDSPNVGYEHKVPHRWQRNPVGHMLNDFGYALAWLFAEHAKTVLMVTHDPRAAERAHATLHLDKGELTA